MKQTKLYAQLNFFTVNECFLKLIQKSILLSHAQNTTNAHSNTDSKMSDEVVKYIGDTYYSFSSKIDHHCTYRHTRCSIRSSQHKIEWMIWAMRVYLPRSL